MNLLAENEKLKRQLGEALEKLTAANRALDEARKQEPVGFIDAEGEPHLAVNGLKGGMLYAAPVPAQQLVSRQTIIDVLVASGNLSEGVTADAIINAIGAQQSPSVSDYEDVLTSYQKLVRELDVLLNGDGAAKQASLCDVVGQVAQIVREKGSPLLQQSPAVAVPELIIEALRKAVYVVDSRAGDVDTEDGSYATTGTDEIIRLESALCEALGTKYDDIDLAEALELIERLPTESVNNGLLSASYARDALHWKSKFHELMASPRITEQDAREIIEDYIGCCDGKRLKPQSSVVMGMYLKNESSALLDKLNGEQK